MLPAELINYFEKDANMRIVEMIHEGKEGLGFRKEHYPYFISNPDAYEFISFEDLDSMSLEFLKENLFLGLNLESMTRITGYMSKVSSWNKGKLAELKDRHRENQGFNLNEKGGTDNE